MPNIGTAVKQILTESDNTTHDLFRYLALVAVVVGLSLEVHACVWQDKPFDLQNYGTGLALLLTGAAAALRIKKETCETTTTETK